MLVRQKMKIVRVIAQFTPVLMLAYFGVAAADEQVHDRAVDVFSHIAFTELAENIVMELVRSGLAERDAVNSATRWMPLGVIKSASS